MNVRPRFVVFAICMLAAGLYAHWFLTHFDRVPVHTDAGYAKEARINRLLAADKLLSVLGLHAESFALLDALPPVTTTVFLPTSRRKFSLERSEALAAWMEAGGHLIVVATPGDEEGSNDALLERYGVSGESVEDRSGGGKTTKIALPGSGAVIDVLFSNAVVLGADVEPLAADETGVRAVSLRVGQGRLTILSDSRFATNRFIRDHDHAAFVWHLVNLEPSASVWLFYGDDSSSLWDRLLASAWQIVTSVAVLGLVLLWAAAGRFGPLAPDEPMPRRRLLEHIEASGKFLWKHGQAVALLDDQRHSLLSSLEFTHPGWVASADLPRRLSELSGLSPASVKRALDIRAVKDENEFLQLSRVLEAIRKHL